MNICIRSKIGKDGTTVDPYWISGKNTVGGKTKLKPARGLEDKTLEFLKKFKESYSLREGNRVRKGSYTILGSGNKKDLSNFVKFTNFENESDFDTYNEFLGDFTSFP